MNKGAIKTFAIWARNKLMSDVANNAYLIGITKDGIQKPLPQSTPDMYYFDIGSGTPYALPKAGITMRNKLVSALEAEAKQSDYATAYRNLLEHTASTWFNRLCAIRFMEVNDYFNDGLRVLSSLEEGKKDSDLMTYPFDSDLGFSEAERQQIVDWKLNNESEKLFGFLLKKKCEEIAGYLPGLFAKNEEPSVLLVSFSIADAEGIVQHLINDIEEEDWKEQVQIIGWLYQFYNIEFKDETNDLLKKRGHVLTKERIPSITQLFTPEWIVKYMVENSLGRIWSEGHPNNELKSNWRYYLEEAEQEPEVWAQLQDICKEYAELTPKDLSFIDPCMGSGHILCYAFDILMQIYESQGYTSRDAVRSILENNLYGLDIDERAYQLAYFSVMMKARQYDQGAFRRDYNPQIYAFEESNGVTERQMEIYGVDLNDMERNVAMSQMKHLISVFKDAKEYGSILEVEHLDWKLLRRFIDSVDAYGRLDLMTMDLSILTEKLKVIISIGEILSHKYWVTCTNPPYLTPTPIQRILIDKKYKFAKSDLYAVFILRLKNLTLPKGYQSMITMHSWMFLASFAEMRRYLIETLSILSMTHLGPRAFDEIPGEVVQTTAFIVRNVTLKKYRAKYYRLVNYMSENEKEKGFHKRSGEYIRDQSIYNIIPSGSLAYWASDAQIEIFKAGETIGSNYKTITGSSTGENATFLRLWSEVDINKVGISLTKEYDGYGFKWIPCIKGGKHRKWYGNFDYLINWENDGEELKKFATFKNHGKHWSRFLKSLNLFYHEGITWSKINTGVFSARYMPEGFIMESAACAIMPSKDNIPYILALMNSSLVETILKMLNPTINIQTGDVTSIPIIKDKNIGLEIQNLTKECITISKEDWDSSEMSWNYKRHPLTQFNVSLISRAFEMWNDETRNRFELLREYEERINSLFANLYGLTEEADIVVEDDKVTVDKANLSRDVKSLISYAVGCMLGRYSLEKEGLAYAGGDWKKAFTNNYLSFIPDDDNCVPITDEDYFPDDIVGRFVEFIKVVYGEESLETNLQFIADAIGGNGGNSREVIRKYFLKDFFKDHCKTYSVTGSGKRPIYWLFDSGNQNGFKALVYMHRWNSDTIATVRTRYVTKVQEKYENELRAMDLQMEHMADPRQKASLQRRKEKILKQVEEIKEYDELIGHLALEHIDIDLDDGVKVNHEKVQQDRNGEKFAILAPIK